jgi:membrane-bound lytic murein transglycosylase B
MKKLFFYSGFLFLTLWLTGCATTNPDYSQRPEVQNFIDEMVVRHHFNRSQLTNLFDQVTPRKIIIKSTSKPKESIEWYNYRPIFVTSQRAREGADFWRAHAKTLAEAQQRYGVPAEIIVAIIGVETRYGQHMGGHRVIDALSTLSFDYPRRARFFRSELENYLLLTRDVPTLNPATLRGSYAGAIGEPQFMPSSYRHYAVDSTGKGYSDLINNSDDAILSVANYFKGHGWITGGRVATSAQQKCLACAKLLVLQGKTGPEYWYCFHNFYVITRYNTSPLYAMAVYQLSEMIRKDYYGK